MSFSNLDLVREKIFSIKAPLENNSRLKEEWSQSLQELQQYEEHYHSLKKRLNEIHQEETWINLEKLEKDVMDFLIEIDKCYLLELSIKYQDNEETRLKLLGKD